jgi:hypothetical protein
MSPKLSRKISRRLNNWFGDIKRLRWQIVMSVFVLLLLFWAFVTSYTIESFSFERHIGNFKVRMFAPKYISPNQEEEIRFSVESGVTDKTHVAFKLKSDGKLMTFVGSPENNDFYSGTVEMQGQMARNMKVYVPFDRHQASKILNQPIGLSLWYGADSHDPQWIDNLSLMTAPVPMARAIQNYLGALLAALGLWMCKELWGQVKA